MAKNVRIKQDVFPADPALLIPAGLIEGFSVVNCFGRNEDIDTAAEETIWGQGGVFVRPTASRIHNLVSTSSTDTSAGTGAQQVFVSGLTSWDAESETSEVVVMTGLTPKATVNSYVIINRMLVVKNGSVAVNAGIITATAVTDATVTITIPVNRGASATTVYGLPSTKVAYMTNYYAAVNKKTTAAVNIRFLVTYRPQLTNNKPVWTHTLSCASAGSSHIQQMFNPYNRFVGPCLIQMNADTSANDSDVSGGYDLIIKDS